MKKFKAQTDTQKLLSKLNTMDKKYQSVVDLSRHTFALQEYIYLSQHQMGTQAANGIVVEMRAISTLYQQNAATFNKMGITAADIRDIFNDLGEPMPDDQKPIFEDPGKAKKMDEYFEKIGQINKNFNSWSTQPGKKEDHVKQVKIKPVKPSKPPKPTKEEKAKEKAVAKEQKAEAKATEKAEKEKRIAKQKALKANLKAAKSGKPPAIPSQQRGAPPETKQKMKVVMVGDGATGKTSYMDVAARGRFEEDFLPNRLGDFQVDHEVNGTNVAIELRDTPSREEFSGLRALHYPNTDVVVISYSVVKPNTLGSVKEKWLPEIKHHLPDAKIVLVGLKEDLRNDPATLAALEKEGKHPVTPEEAQAVASEIGASAHVTCLAFEEGRQDPSLRSGTHQVEEVLTQAVNAASWAELDKQQQHDYSGPSSRSGI